MICGCKGNAFWTDGYVKNGHPCFAMQECPFRECYIKFSIFIFFFISPLNFCPKASVNS